MNIQTKEKWKTVIFSITGFSSFIVPNWNTNINLLFHFHFFCFQEHKIWLWCFVVFYIYTICVSIRLNMNYTVSFVNKIKSVDICFWTEPSYCCCCFFRDCFVCICVDFINRKKREMNVCIDARWIENDP